MDLWYNNYRYMILGFRFLQSGIGNTFIFSFSTFSPFGGINSNCQYIWFNII